MAGLPADRALIYPVSRIKPVSQLRGVPVLLHCRTVAWRRMNQKGTIALLTCTTVMQQAIRISIISRLPSLYLVIHSDGMQFAS
ncbi:hypothetical protein [Pectobacterium sp. A5351]|uniref:hypothetical protein n=1 Tax=Pectobacterium sp. A5351 TaxID=2914983 RepID=UPI0023311761|nr:hypothetical protein [Pectobacterium sp. A5351]WCG83633.1 hypothetical protein O1Q74_02700 [Pectobacterium sp. A5351]